MTDYEVYLDADDSREPFKTRPRYFPNAEIPIPSDEWIAMHPEEYSFEESAAAWERLPQETRDRLEAEFEDEHPEMSEPYTPGLDDYRWPPRPAHVW